MHRSVGCFGVCLFVLAFFFFCGNKYNKICNQLGHIHFVSSITVESFQEIGYILFFFVQVTEGIKRMMLNGTSNYLPISYVMF